MLFILLAEDYFTNDYPEEDEDACYSNSRHKSIYMNHRNQESSESDGEDMILVHHLRHRLYPAKNALGKHANTSHFDRLRQDD